MTHGAAMIISTFTKRAALICALSIPLLGCSTDGWQSASREPAGIAPEPDSTPEAVVQVYAADAWSWRGWFAVHSWIATKAENADTYTVYEVVGFRLKRGLPALRIEQREHPDRYWYGAEPELVYDARGDKASALIPQIADVVERYPWKNEYSVFPGPNSNTFPQWVIDHVDGFDAKLPFRAIGSGYADNDES
jgi:hypothetical protein